MDTHTNIPHGSSHGQGPADPTTDVNKLVLSPAEFFPACSGLAREGLRRYEPCYLPKNTSILLHLLGDGPSPLKDLPRSHCFKAWASNSSPVLHCLSSGEHQRTGVTHEARAALSGLSGRRHGRWCRIRAPSSGRRSGPSNLFAQTVTQMSDIFTQRAAMSSLQPPSVRHTAHSPTMGSEGPLQKNEAKSPAFTIFADL